MLPRVAARQVLRRRACLRAARAERYARERCCSLPPRSHDAYDAVANLILPRDVFMRARRAMAVICASRGAAGKCATPRRERCKMFYDHSSSVREVLQPMQKRCGGDDASPRAGDVFTSPDTVVQVCVTTRRRHARYAFISTADSRRKCRRCAPHFDYLTFIRKQDVMLDARVPPLRRRAAARKMMRAHERLCRRAARPLFFFPQACRPLLRARSRRFVPLHRQMMTMLASAERREDMRAMSFHAR